MSRESDRLELTQCLLLAYEGGLTDEHCDFILQCLLSEDEHIVKMAAVLIPVLERPHVLQLLSHWDRFPIAAKRHAVIFLAVMDFYEPYEKMLDDLVTTQDEGYARVLSECLGRTEYFVFPLILPLLGTSDFLVLSRLKRVLTLGGLDRIKLYIQLVPQLPFIQVFQDVFGADVIAQLRGTA